MKNILFFIEQEYYWASLEPVYREFEKDGSCSLSVKIGDNSRKVFKLFNVSMKKQIEKKFKEAGIPVTDQTKGFDAVFAGAQIKNPERFGNALLCNLDHGPGIKTLRYRHLLKQKDTKYVCFLEGEYRYEKFKKYGLDKIHDVYITGLPKLDKFFNGYYNREHLRKELGLSNDRKTILYAPSYKPTSIFIVGEQIKELSNIYDVIVKLHPYSWGGKYASHSHHRYFEKIQKENPKLKLVGPDKHDILPYMFASDTMISDGSSVINEFLALERCGIIINLPDEQQTHSDGTPLLENKSSEWLKDSFIHINPGDDLQEAVKEALNPDSKRKENLVKDKNYIFSYTDGNSASRVKKITEQILSE